MPRTERPDVSFRGPGGRRIRFETCTWTIDRRDGLHIHLRARIRPEDWSVIDEKGWFHLDTGQRGECLGGPFTEGDSVYIEARLSPTLTEAAAMLTEGDAELLEELAQPSLLPGLSEARSWYCTSATRKVSSRLLFGFRMTHAELGRPRG